PEAGLARPQAVVGVLEIGLEVERQSADGVDQLALQVGAGEDDPLDVVDPGILADVFLQRSDLLAPDGVRQDVGAGVEEAAAGQDEPAADDADVGGGVGAAAQALQPVALEELQVVVEEDDVRGGIGDGDPGVVAAHEPDVPRQGDHPQPRWSPG